VARTRSPNYPYVGLPTALERVRKIYDQDHRNRMSREVVASHLGYGSLNGVSMSVISALSKYGLLESIDSDLQVSDDAVTILVDVPDSPDRIMALRRAALKPELFSELHKYFGAQSPSDTNLVAHLQKKGFTANAAAQAAKSFRETMQLVSQQTGGYSGGEDFSREANGTPNPQQPIPERTPPPQPAAAQLNPGEQELFRSKLSPQSTVRVLITGPAGPKEIDKLVRLLQLQKEVMQEDGENEV
jgi:hypothetical protein